MELHRISLKSTGHYGRMAALLAASAVLPLCASDMTVADSTALSADLSVDKLTVAKNKTLDLAGHSLTCTSISGTTAGYIVDSGARYRAVSAPEPSDGQYIQGTGQLWINTGVVPDCTDTIEAKIYLDEGATKKSVNYLWSARGTDINQNYLNCRTTGTSSWEYVFERCGEADVSSDSGGNYKQKTTVEIVANYDSGVISITGSNTDSLQMQFGEGGAESFTVGGPLVLFAANKSGWAANHERGAGGMTGYFCNYGKGVRLYYFRVRKKNGELRCNFVPARIANTGIVGLFDTVGGGFVTRELKSPGVIAAGADVYEVERVSGGELHLNLAANATITKILFGSGVKIVKEGGATLTMSPGANSTGYFGGIEVAGGTLKPGVNGTNDPLGIEGGEVTVDAGATFDVNKMCFLRDSRFTLAGGKLTHAGTAGFYNTAVHMTNVVKYVRLTQDSELAVGATTFGMWDCDEADYDAAGGTNTNYKTTYIDLGGKKLTVTGGSNWARPVFAGLEALSAGTIYATNSCRGLIFYGKDSDLGKATLVSDTNIRVQDGITLTLGGYVSDATANTDSRATETWDNGKGVVKILGTFKPNTDYYHGCELADGATLDVSGRTTPLDLDGSRVEPNAEDHQYKVSFADDATIAIATGERVLSSSKPVVTWQSAPANLSTLKFVCAPGENNRGFVIKEDGVYPSPLGLIISFH